jgi:hypothetical protein
MTHRYATMKADTVIGIIAAKGRLDDGGAGFLSDDAESRYFEKLMAEGFRWKMTVDGMAVFERYYPDVEYITSKTFDLHVEYVAEDLRERVRELGGNPHHCTTEEIAAAFRALGYQCVALDHETLLGPVRR